MDMGFDRTCLMHQPQDPVDFSNRAADHEQVFAILEKLLIAKTHVPRNAQPGPDAP